MIERLGLSLLLLAPLAAPARAADVTGNWRVTISTSDGAITGKASLKQSGDMVTGWVGPDESDPIPVTGTLKGNKLTIKTSPQPGRTAAFDKCDLTVNGDKMVGTIDTDKGKIEFVKSTPSSRQTGRAAASALPHSKPYLPFGASCLMLCLSEVINTGIKTPKRYII